MGRPAASSSARMRPVLAISRHIERQHRHFGQKFFNPAQEPLRSSLSATVAQFRRHDDADANRIACCSGALSGLPDGMPDQLADNVRVQHVKHGQKTCFGAGGGSSISGNASFNGSQLFSSATNPFLRTGSMMRRSPSRLMIASLPGNSNSTGMRTAWLRLLRNSRYLTRCGIGLGHSLGLFGICL